MQTPTNMYLREVAERAALLMRLEHGRDEVKMRIHAKVAWDFELHASPVFASRIDAIIDEVFSRQGR